MNNIDDTIVSMAKLELTQRIVTLQYAVKFVCGKSAGEAVAPGFYYTAINLHNPTDRNIRFQRKIAVALPDEQGPVSSFSKEDLGPDGALEIDCKGIRKQAEIAGDFLKGFVVIKSIVELDVVAVYTVASRDQQVVAIHTERVTPRRREFRFPKLGA
mgnify:CR=1 FL=1